MDARLDGPGRRAVSGLPRPADDEPSRSGPGGKSDLLLRRTAETAADHLSGDDREPAAADSVSGAALRLSTLSERKRARHDLWRALSVFRNPEDHYRRSDR